MLGVSSSMFLTLSRLLVLLCYKTKPRALFLLRCLVSLVGEDEIVSPSGQEELDRGVCNSEKLPLAHALPNHDALPWPHPLSASIGWWDQRVETRKELGTRTSGPVLRVKPTPWLICLFMSNCGRREVDRGAGAQPGQVGHLGSDFSCLTTLCNGKVS